MASHFRSLCIALLLTSSAASVAADKADPIVVEDPQYGEALYYFYQDDYFPAIVRLLAAQERQQLTNHEQDAELLLGGMYLSYGHHLEAAEIFERLLAENVSTDIRNRTWFFLAKIWYQRGYHEKSIEALGYITGGLPDNLQREALLLEAQILIEAGNYDDAIALLQNWRGRTEWASYAKFNIGVALVRSGRINEARNLLNELGTLNPFNEELTSLRDKANLALGYALLQDEQPAAAKIPLQRVRLEGPFSNKALLGVGWADAEMDNYRGALVPWMELQDRDLLDSAVQESMLAVPYALAELDSVSQAADHYLNAVEAFYEESNRLDATIARLESGELFDEFLGDAPVDSTGWYWQFEDLPEGPDSRYLFHLFASHEFQEGLKNYRDLFYLHRNLDDWQGNVDVYANMLETRKQAYEERLPKVEDALARADLDELVARKLDYDSTLNNVTDSNDWLALATEDEFELWSEIVTYENSPALRANLPEATETRNKIQLLKGVLQWNLERDFNERMWRIRRDLKAAGEELVATQRSRRQIDETMRQEPIRFAELSDRVYGLAPQIESIKIRVEDVMTEQQAYLRSIAVKELQAQKQRIETYTLQARFALAAIYDTAATEGEAIE